MTCVRERAPERVHMVARRCGEHDAHPAREGSPRRTRSRSTRTRPRSRTGTRELDRLEGEVKRCDRARSATRSVTWSNSSSVEHALVPRGDPRERVVRTMDASLRQRARWRSPATGSPAGSGRMRPHWPARLIELAGRWRSRITESHVHFPTWAAARRLIRSRGHLGRGRGPRMRPGVGDVKPGRWFRAQGFREPTAGAADQGVLDAVTGDVPAAVISKNFHAIWLNSAGNREDRRRPAQVRCPRRRGRARPGTGEPTGLIREGSAWRFKEDISIFGRGYGRAPRGVEGRVLARRHRDPRQGRLDPGDPATVAGARARRRAAVQVWQSIPHQRLDGSPPPASSPCWGALRLGYLEVFITDAGSQTALMTDGSCVACPAARSLRASSAVRRRALAVACTRSTSPTRTRRRVRPDTRRLAAAGPRHRIELQCLLPRTSAASPTSV